MNKYISTFRHIIVSLLYKINSYIFTQQYTGSFLPTSFRKDSHKLKIFTYDLPRRYSRNEIYDLRIVYETYLAISLYFRNYVNVDDPAEADYFFVPIFLHKYQFLNSNPEELLSMLKYLSKKKDHIMIASGDFSQRSGTNKFGEAYKQRYSWLDNFILLALESTDDLIKGQDIGIIPLNTLSEKPLFNDNHRPYLYSFFGELNHLYLPKNHVRHQLNKIKSGSNVLISSKLISSERQRLNMNYNTSNDYELVARNSIFTLCPAGYGKWTYRFFQAIQWGSIPVLISDTYIKPFSQFIHYDDFCLTIKESEIAHVDQIIRKLSTKRIKRMQDNLRNAQTHFTLPSFFRYLQKSLIANKVNR